MGHSESRALGASAVESCHKGAYAGAVDIAEICEVENDLFFAGCQHAFDLLPKRIALFAQNDASFDIQHIYIVRTSVRHSYRQVDASFGNCLRLFRTSVGPV